MQARNTFLFGLKFMNIFGALNSLPFLKEASSAFKLNANMFLWISFYAVHSVKTKREISSRWYGRKQINYFEKLVWTSNTVLNAVLFRVLSIKSESYKIHVHDIFAFSRNPLFHNSLSSNYVKRNLTNIGNQCHHELAWIDLSRIKKIHMPSLLEFVKWR